MVPSPFTRLLLQKLTRRLVHPNRKQMQFSNRPIRRQKKGSVMITITAFAPGEEILKTSHVTGRLDSH